MCAPRAPIIGGRGVTPWEPVTPDNPPESPLRICQGPWYSPICHDKKLSENLVLANLTGEGGGGSTQPSTPEKAAPLPPNFDVPRRWPGGHVPGAVAPGGLPDRPAGVGGGALPRLGRRPGVGRVGVSGRLSSARSPGAWAEWDSWTEAPGSVVHRNIKTRCFGVRKISSAFPTPRGQSGTPCPSAGVVWNPLHAEQGWVHFALFRILHIFFRIFPTHFFFCCLVHSPPPEFPPISHFLTMTQYT